MPALIFGVPSLQALTLKGHFVFSVILLALCAYYADYQARRSSSWDNETEASAEEEEELSVGLNELFVYLKKEIKDGDDISFSYWQNFVSVILADGFCLWAVLNMCLCGLMVFFRIVQQLVFGELRVNEKQNLKDRFWHFVFYKFIFIFGVLNVQTLDETVLWFAWSSLQGFFHLLSEISRVRFEYLSMVQSSSLLTYIRLIVLLLTIVALSLGMMIASILFSSEYSTNILGFLLAQSLMLVVRPIYVLVRYGIHLIDIKREGTWENKDTYIYYTQFLADLTILILDLCHHVHMLLWANIFLSMASLVICMQLRFLYTEIQRKLRRHGNYRRVVNSLQTKFPEATAEELSESSDCAICWDHMISARRLPCGHLFHRSCLRSWLEQDSSCPTCRASLKSVMEEQPYPRGSGRQATAVPPQAGDLAGTTSGQPGAPNQIGRNNVAADPNQRNHFFHFDGSRIASWLPRFSVEVTMEPQQSHLQLDAMVDQVLQMFPQVPRNALFEDLRLTRSVELTVENILNDRLPQTPISAAVLPDDDNENIIIDADTAQVPEETEPLEEVQQQQQQQQLQINYEDENSESEMNAQNDGSVEVIGGRFSKSPEEREGLLKHRKHTLLQSAKRRLLEKDKKRRNESNPAAARSGEQGETSSMSQQRPDTALLRRGLLLQAAQRRFEQQLDNSEDGGSQ